MTHNGSEAIEQNTSSTTWWTPRRIKLAGLAGFTGGLDGLLSSFGGFGVGGLPIGNTGIGIATGAISILYPV